MCSGSFSAIASFPGNDHLVHGHSKRYSPVVSKIDGEEHVGRKMGYSIYNAAPTACNETRDIVEKLVHNFWRGRRLVRFGFV